MIFQEPMTSLSPVHTVGNQITEAIMLHRGVNKTEAYQRAVEMLKQVGIGNAEQRFHEYPHQLSGGLRQRCMIAMALSCNPRLLIADEPTTALDVTIQAQILELLRQLQADFGMAILMITHNLGVIAEMANRVAVMYMGKVVEMADARTLFNQPQHPYTIGLLRSLPRVGRDVKARLASIPGHRARPVQPPAGLQLLPALPGPEARRLPGRAGAADRADAGPLVRCTLYEPSAAPPARGDGMTRRHGHGNGPQSRAAAATPGARGSTGQLLLDVRDIKKYFPIQRGLLRAPSGTSRRWTASASRSTRARRSAWWASPAAARRPPAGWSCAPSKPTAGEIWFRHEDQMVDLTADVAAAAQADPPRHADDLPGPVLVAEPADDGARDRRRAADDPRRAPTATS